MVERYRLTPLKVKALDKPGRHADGGNLYVTVAPSGAKTWCFLYRQPGTGKQREAGFGSVDAMSLKEARERARQGRSMIAQGQDPLDAWKAEKAAKRAPTFAEAATMHFEKKRGEWRNPQSIAGEEALVRNYAKKLMATPVDQITTDAVLAVLKPIWHQVPDSARRLRGRIEAVIGAGYVMAGVDKTNPARWKHHLDNLLPKPRRPTHYAALPYVEVPAFVAELRRNSGDAPAGSLTDLYSLPLEFLILTATRANETLQAKWSEVNFDTKTWVIPKERMKKGERQHRVPLSDRALEILKARRAVVHEDEERVFKGSYAALNSRGLERLVEKMGLKDKATPHGFRSSFRDWVDEQTSTPFAVAEQCLSHKVGDSTVQAYARSDLLEQRRPVMAMWSTYLDGGPGAEVLPFPQANTR
jgi:integrase